MQTSKFKGSRNVLVVIVGSLCFCIAASPVPYVVEFTSPEQFEHQTQASTGGLIPDLNYWCYQPTSKPPVCKSSLTHIAAAYRDIKLLSGDLCVPCPVVLHCS
jgi:hypothetical protein